MVNTGGMTVNQDNVANEVNEPAGKSWIRIGTLAEIQEAENKVVRGIVVFAHEGNVYAVENRCPHMGFPLHRGSLCNGILTCHWHHARFDVCSGGTLNPWADDVPSHDVRVEQGIVWVNSKPKTARTIEGHKARLRQGLEQNISLIIAKSVIALMAAGVPDNHIAQVGFEFGTAQRARGWGSGLTILAAMVNVLPKLDQYGRMLALVQGLVHVARDCAGMAPRFLLQPLPDTEVDFERLASWYRQCVEVRDSDGAERILRVMLKKGSSRQLISDMMLAATTDHFYLDGGHTLDFHNKALESLNHVDPRCHEQLLSSLVPLLENPTRSEELQNWRSPVDLVSPLLEAFRKLPESNHLANSDVNDQQFVEQLLSDEPLKTIQMLTEAVQRGVSLTHLAQLTVLAAATRIQQFHVQNDFGDWIAVLHTFTHAHAVHQRLLESPSPLTFRGVYHAAMRIYLDRFLNIPSARHPDVQQARQAGFSTDLEELLRLTDQRQRVAEAANWVALFLEERANDVPALLNSLGHMLLREDAEFHSFQMYEAALAEYDSWSTSQRPIAKHAQHTLLFALTRNLAAHAPTARELPQIARIAWRLEHGEHLFEEE